MIINITVVCCYCSLLLYSFSWQASPVPAKVPPNLQIQIFEVFHLTRQNNILLGHFGLWFCFLLFFF